MTIFVRHVTTKEDIVFPVELKPGQTVVHCPKCGDWLPVPEPM